MGLGSLLLEEGAIQASDTREVGRGILDAGRMLEGLIEKFLAYAELHTATSVDAVGLLSEEAFETAREEATSVRAHLSPLGNARLRKALYMTTLSAARSRVLPARSTSLRRPRAPSGEARTVR
jgi:hypothetical protein